MQGWKRAMNTLSVRRPPAPQYQVAKPYDERSEREKAVGDKTGSEQLGQ